MLTANAIARWSEIYSGQNGDKLPTGWNDFKGLFEEPLENIMRHSAPVKRYAFLNFPLLLTTKEIGKGEVFAINRSDIYDTTLSAGLLGLRSGLKGPGRYVIYRTDREERFECLWMSAGDVKTLFSSQNAQLPEPDHEPERVWVMKARKASYFRIAIYGALLCGAASLVLWKWGAFRFLARRSQQT